MNREANLKSEVTALGTEFVSLKLNERALCESLAWRNTGSYAQNQSLWLEGTPKLCKLYAHKWRITVGEHVGELKTVNTTFFFSSSFFPCTFWARMFNVPLRTPLILYIDVECPLQNAHPLQTSLEGEASHTILFCNWQGALRCRHRLGLFAIKNQSWFFFPRTRGHLRWL